MICQLAPGQAGGGSLCSSAMVQRAFLGPARSEAADLRPTRTGSATRRTRIRDRQHHIYAAYRRGTKCYTWHRTATTHTIPYTYFSLTVTHFPVIRKYVCTETSLDYVLYKL